MHPPLTLTVEPIRLFPKVDFAPRLGRLELMTLGFGGSVQVNLRSENHRIGLSVRVISQSV